MGMFDVWVAFFGGIMVTLIIMILVLIIIVMVTGKNDDGRRNDCNKCDGCGYERKNK